MMADQYILKLESASDYSIEDDPIFQLDDYRNILENCADTAAWCTVDATKICQQKTGVSFDAVYNDLYTWRTTLAPEEFNDFRELDYKEAVRWKSMGVYENLTTEQVAAKLWSRKKRYINPSS